MVRTIPGFPNRGLSGTKPPAAHRNRFSVTQAEPPTASRGSGRSVLSAGYGAVASLSVGSLGVVGTYGRCSSWPASRCAVRRRTSGCDRGLRRIRRCADAVSAASGRAVARSATVIGLAAGDSAMTATASTATGTARSTHTVPSAGPRRQCSMRRGTAAVGRPAAHPAHRPGTRRHHPLTTGQPDQQVGAPPRMLGGRNSAAPEAVANDCGPPVPAPGKRSPTPTGSWPQSSTGVAASPTPPRRTLRNQLADRHPHHPGDPTPPGPARMHNPPLHRTIHHPPQTGPPTSTPTAPSSRTTSNTHVDSLRVPIFRTDARCPAVGGAVVEHVPHKPPIRKRSTQRRMCRARRGHHRSY